MVVKSSEKRNTGRFRVNTGTRVNAHEMNGEDIVNESEPAATSNFSEERRTTMSSLVKAKASLCYTYSMDFGNLVEEHKLGLKKHLGGRVHLALANALFNKRGDQNDDHKENDAFDLYDMNDVSRIRATS